MLNLVIELNADKWSNISGVRADEKHVLGISFVSAKSDLLAFRVLGRMNGSMIQPEHILGHS